MLNKYAFIAVDIQNEFASKGGRYYTPKKSVKFLKNILFPFLKSNRICIGEIVSDYRNPRPGNREECCLPGKWGYRSLIPVQLKKNPVWVKCMHSPVWIRKDFGSSKKRAGMPIPNSKKFTNWLEKIIGRHQNTVPVVIGLTIDCCVLATVQELSWRGYKPIILKEGVDSDSGKINDRNKILKLVIKNWAKTVSWQELRPLLITRSGK